VGAVGRTDLTGASLDTLLKSLEEKLLALPKDTVIWPGHDYGETRMAPQEMRLYPNFLRCYMSSFSKGRGEHFLRFGEQELVFFYPVL
jgi:glyoxylase-like metal-dependent hydrolase (beta-lactamase superfamily II)